MKNVLTSLAVAAAVLTAPAASFQVKNDMVNAGRFYSASNKNPLCCHQVTALPPRPRYSVIAPRDNPWGP